MWEAEGGGDRRSILGSGTIAAYITGVASKGDHTVSRLILGSTSPRSCIGNAAVGGGQAERFLSNSVPRGGWRADPILGAPRTGQVGATLPQLISAFMME